MTSLRNRCSTLLNDRLLTWGADCWAILVVNVDSRFRRRKESRRREEGREIPPYGPAVAVGVSTRRSLHAGVPECLENAGGILGFFFPQSLLELKTSYAHSAAVFGSCLPPLFFHAPLTAADRHIFTGAPSLPPPLVFRFRLCFLGQCCGGRLFHRSRARPEGRDALPGDTSTEAALRSPVSDRLQGISDDGTGEVVG